MTDLIKPTQAGRDGAVIWRNALQAADAADWGHDDCECCVEERERAAVEIIIQAFAAMLDDMAEPSEAVLATVVANAEVRPMAMRFWQAMLAQYRKDAKL